MEHSFFFFSPSITKSFPLFLSLFFVVCCPVVTCCFLLAKKRHKKRRRKKHLYNSKQRYDTTQAAQHIHDGECVLRPDDHHTCTFMKIKRGGLLIVFT